MQLEIALPVSIGSVIAIIGLVIGIAWLLLRKPPLLWREEHSHGPSSRKLGGSEVFMARLGKTGDYMITTIIFVRSKFPLTEINVRKAMIALSQRHPLLRMRLGKENGEYTYMKEIEDFRVDLEVCDTKDWKGLMGDETQTLYDAEKGPLWKVKFIPETSYEDGEEAGYPYQAACIFGFHHTITDASSFLRLFGEFVERLQAIQENDEHPIESMPLLPPLDAYIDNAKIYSPKYNLKANIIHGVGMLTRAFPSILPYLLKTVSKPALLVKNLGVEIDRNPKAVERTCLVPVELTREQTSQLLASCKRHKTTVQCVIQTAACLAYSAMTDGGKITRTHNIACGLSVNLRRFLGKPELNDYCGMFISDFLMNTTVGPALTFWDIASKIGVDLQGALTSHEPFLFYNFVSMLAKTAEEPNLLFDLAATLPGKRDHDLDFHNYGNFNFLNKDKTSPCKLSGFFITGPAFNLGPVFGNALVTINGKLSWSFIGGLHICSEEQTNKYADMTMKLLLEAMKE